jgi:2-phospho-L-lactate guanylyltransferase
MTGVYGTSWAVVIPVKPLGLAKTRLGGGIAVPTDRLMLAFAQDTVAAALDCLVVREVLVVTNDTRVTAAVTELGAVCVPDKPDAGLNAAVRHGILSVPDGSGVAVLTADLPALRPAELAAALALVVDGQAFVPDAPGSGTVLLAAPAGIAVEPRFGPHSARDHEASGAVRLSGDWPSLRRDVDTPDDLTAAAALGLGRHTARLLAGIP